MGSSSTTIMFHFANSFLPLLCWLIIIISCTTNSILHVNAQLYPHFYARSCPHLERIVRTSMTEIVSHDPRMAASILRLFFHDCFVNGCDASVLLDDTPWSQGEKNAIGNQNSLRGFKVMDRLKYLVEGACKQTVSCADILALAARDAVHLVGGPNWEVPLGRRDTRVASLYAANTNLPPATSSLSDMIALFASKNLTARDMTALSGAHTIGQARCTSFRARIYNEPNIQSQFSFSKRVTCPPYGGDDNLAPFDMGTPDRFDNGYFRSLMANQGLLHSDQELYNGGSQDSWVRLYARSNYAFGKDFEAAMVKLGNLSPLTGTNGEIRRNCRFVN